MDEGTNYYEGVDGEYADLYYEHYVEDAEMEGAFDSTAPRGGMQGRGRWSGQG